VVVYKTIAMLSVYSIRDMNFAANKIIIYENKAKADNVKTRAWRQEARKKGLRLIRKMTNKKTAILNRIADNRAEYVGFCRYLNNEHVKWEELVKENNNRLSQTCAGKHVLLINDTTEFNYNSHAGFLNKNDKDLGPTGDNKTIGFFCHPGLVIDSSTGFGLGFSYLKIWNRHWDKKDKSERNYKRQEIEKKESYRWIECGLKSKEVLKRATQVTIIADRESDIYEEFVLVPDSRTNLIIRSRGNRSLKDNGKTLYSVLSEEEVRGTYNLTVRNAKNRQGRQTQIEVKYTRVSLKKPHNRIINKTIPHYVEVNVIEAKEVASNVPKGEKPIHWVLLTTHDITNIQDVFQTITWYGMRWQIELLFATLKSKGLDIEASEMESGSALKKLCVIALHVALLINQLRQARDDESGIPAGIAFTKNQIALLVVLVKKFEGKTEKQKNPFSPDTLAWASWAIARLGGWKGYACESPPGNKTFKWGIDRFYAMSDGFLLHQQMCA
jgi:hypothetical protein